MFVMLQCYMSLLLGCLLKQDIFTGLLWKAQVHCDPGSKGEHDKRLLANGVGAGLKGNRDGNRL